MSHQKRPRQYALEIGKLATLEQRRAALKQVPKDYQEIVKTHLRIMFERDKWQKLKASA